MDRHPQIRLCLVAHLFVFLFAFEGILIDSSSRGPIVHAIKDGSPLLHLVEEGDVVVSVDGVDCRGKTADALAHWIGTKPRLPEQVLVLRGHPQESEYSDTEMSV